MAQISGDKKHADRLKRMVARTPRQVAAALYAAGQEIELEAERSIVAGSISGKGHVASAPGQPPNADTRDLDSKIETEIVMQSPPTVDVRAYSEHAVFLEYGTSRMVERPFMRPAVAKKRKVAAKLVGDALSITIK